MPAARTASSCWSSTYLATAWSGSRRAVCEPEVLPLAPPRLPIFRRGRTCAGAAGPRTQETGEAAAAPAPHRARRSQCAGGRDDETRRDNRVTVLTIRCGPVCALWAREAVPLPVRRWRTCEQTPRRSADVAAAAGAGRARAFEVRGSSRLPCGCALTRPLWFGAQKAEQSNTVRTKL